MRAKVLSALRVAGAVGLCAGLAVVLSLVFQGRDLEFRSKLPFVFLIVILLVARKAGEMAAILSMVAAGLVFALLLFHPLGSLGVQAKEARSSLAWFLLGGMVCAHLLSPATPKTRRRQSNFSEHHSDSD